jgi:multidrug resistance efflux pump
MRFVKLFVVLALLGGAGWQGAALYRSAFAASQKPIVIPQHRVQRGDLRLTLASYGTLEASNTYSLRNKGSSASGGIRGVESQIVEIIEDGIVIPKGQVVVRLDKTKFEKQLRDRKLAYENALATLKRVEADTALNVQNSATKLKKAEMEQSLLLSGSRADIAQAQAETRYNAAELDYDKKNLERTARLAKEQLKPVTEVEQADLAVKRSEFAVTSGTRQLESKQHAQRSAASQGELVISDARFTAAVTANKARDAVENARFNAESARRLYELAKQQIEWCEIRSPVAGLVVIERDMDRSSGTVRLKQPGDPVRPNERLMQIIDLARMRVSADVGEIDASRIKVGQAVRVWPRSAPDTVLKGRVFSVSQLARQGDTYRRNAIPGKKTFRVVIEVLESRPDILRPGLTADFEIQRGQVAHVLRLPLEALFKTSKGATVFVKKGERYAVRPVKIGARNANFVAVVAGLKEGEEVTLRRPPAQLLGDPATQPQARRNLLRWITAGGWFGFQS